MRKQTNQNLARHTWSSFLPALALAVCIVFPTLVLAQNLEPDAPPASTLSYSLQDLYNRLDSGAPGTQAAFAEPPAGPIAATMVDMNAVMGKAPERDDVHGATADHVLEGKTFWGLRSGTGWGLITGTLEGGGDGDAVDVPKTGQTTSYGTRDDGALQRGVAWPSPRFTDNGDGTVTDNLTNLVWLKNANCFGPKLWTTALADANELADGLCGLDDDSEAGDWWLPNSRELFSLIDKSRFSPALPSGHPFTGVQMNYYWSSTTYAGDTDSAWGVTMLYGSVVFGFKTITFNHVWPVRAGE